GVKAKNAMETIGVGSKRKKIKNRLVTVYVVNNAKRFTSYNPESEQPKELKLFSNIDDVL
ncbi:phage resistance protein, partial [Streptococcus suis]|nr:phage resistance protein [Streptococcus suis]